jgi:hypothetical protein
MHLIDRIVLERCHADFQPMTPLKGLGSYQVLDASFARTEIVSTGSSAREAARTGRPCAAPVR